MRVVTETITMPPFTPAAGRASTAPGIGLAIAAAVRRHINVNGGAVHTR
jgi:hypothetical protein